MNNKKSNTVTCPSFDGDISTTVEIRSGFTCGCGDCDYTDPVVIITTSYRDADGFVRTMTQKVHGINPATAYVV